MYGRILRQLRESRGRSQAEVARTVGLSAAHLARLETDQRRLYLDDFVLISEALGEKPGNLLPNDLGDLRPLKPIIDALASVPTELLPATASIVRGVVDLARKEQEKPDASAGRRTNDASPSS